MIAVRPDDDVWPATPEASVPAPPAMDFAAVYAQQFDFVWRSVRRLGVPTSGVDDAVQDVFLVVHRRFSEFEARSSLKTWIFGIVLNVVRRRRRTAARRPECEPLADDAAIEATPAEQFDSVARAEALQMLEGFLDALDDAKREVFVLTELEQMSVLEAARALGVNPYTLYARRRVVRREFDQAVARHNARAQWRTSCATNTATKRR
jgi:RNA polymerase sigma-70 factor (ECF subfamily)